MTDLKSLVEHEMDRAGAPAFGLGEVRTRRDRMRRNQRLAAGAISVAIVVAVAWLGVTMSRSPHTVPADNSAPTPAVSVRAPFPSPTLAQSDWSPVVERSSSVVHGHKWSDPRDTSVAWVDLETVNYDTYNAGHWTISLPADPPRAVTLGPGRIISYGLVLDTTGDGTADYLVGLNNDTPKKGDFHTWVTDLATGETTEEFGPPYGVPIEFSHPDEPGTNRSVILTFLPTTEPTGLDPKTVRFYAWAAETSGEEVIASDFAPDTGWMSR